MKIRDVTFALVPLLLAPSARAQPRAISVSVDAAATGSYLQKIWGFYGYDEINYTTAPEGTALLGALVTAHASPVYVRNHFLFNNGDGTPAMKWGSTNVYSEDAAGTPVYDWALTDGVFDALTGAGARPFVELGFMPEALSTHPSPYPNSALNMLDSGSFYPPEDYEKWAELVRTWATHANSRYPDVAASWLWELWNEPDLDYWRGTFAEYAELYDHTESALHAVLPEAKLGGPAVAGAGSPFLKNFLEHCVSGTNAVTAGRGTRLDLVTFHAKGGVNLVDGHVQMDLGNHLRLHRYGFDAVAAFPEFVQTPIYVTEADPDGCAACPVSQVPANAYRTSNAYGAYELAMMKRSLELAAERGVRLSGVLTWAFTFPGTPYFAGYRELATNGVALPVLGAFKLLGRLDGTRVPLISSGAAPLDDVVRTGVRGEAEIDGIAAREGGVVRVLIWNYHDDLVPATATPVELKIRVPPDLGRRARVAHLRVDESHGNAYRVWVSLGMPATPTPAQVATLVQAMEPARLRPDEIVAVAADGTVDVGFELPRFGISLLEISPEIEETTQRSGCACRAAAAESSAAEVVTWLAATVAALNVLVARRRYRSAGEKLS